MNTPVAPDTVTEPPASALTAISIEKLALSTTHIQETRRKRFDPAKLAELTESVRKSGVLQPILARPFPESRKLDPKLIFATHEIVAGERRYLAARAAGHHDIPAVVRTLSDIEVLEAQLVENLQREGLHEMEEAEGYAELMKLKKITGKDVAAQVGKSESYVSARLKLLELCTEAREAFYAGQFPASIALLLGRIPRADTQVKAMKEILSPNYQGDSMSYRRAQEHVQEHFMRELKASPFKLDDAELVPKAGTCAACPKRSGNQKDLFTDVKNANVCTDPKCYEDKLAAHQARVRAKFEAEGRKVIAGAAAKKIAQYGQIRNGYTALDDKNYDDAKCRSFRQILGKDATPEAVLIEVEDREGVEFVEAIPNTALKLALEKAGFKSRTHSTRLSGPSPAEKKAKLETKARRAIYDAVRAKKRERAFDGDDLRHIVTVVWDRWWFDHQKPVAKLWLPETVKKSDRDRIEWVAKQIPQMTEAELALLLLDCTMTGRLDANSYKDTEDLDALAKRAGVDAAKIRAGIKEEQEAKAKPKKKAKAK